MRRFGAGWMGGLLLWGTTPGMARGEEDAVSAEERVMEDGDEEDAAFSPEWSGDFRLRLRETYPPGSTYESAPPPLQHPLYVSSRFRLARGPLSAGVLVKRAAVGPALAPEALRRYGTFKASLEGRNATDTSRWVVGDYRLVFGQGLLFYDGFGEVVRPAKIRDAGPRPDFSTSPREGLRGAAVRWRPGFSGVDVFYSEKAHALSLNSDGTVNENLDDFHDDPGDVQTEEAFLDPQAVVERLVGARVLLWEGGRGHWGATGYRASFNRTFAPVSTAFADARAFRGNRWNLWGSDWEFPLGAGSLVGEWAMSQPGGDAGRLNNGRGATVSFLQKADLSRWWVTLFDYDQHFLSPHGKAAAFSVTGGSDALARNQTGVQAGGECRAGPWRARVNLTAARFPGARGNGSDSGPLTSSSGRYALLDQQVALSSAVDVRFLVTDRWEGKRVDAAPGGPGVDLEGVRRWRGELGWDASPTWTWRLRWEGREEREDGTIHRGRMSVVDLIHRPTSRTTLKARVYFFNSREADLSTGMEEIGPGVVYPRLAGNAGDLRGTPGTRWVLGWTQSWGSHGRWWVKLEETRRPADNDGAGSSRRAWHLQWDEWWGGK